MEGLNCFGWTSGGSGGGGGGNITGGGTINYVAMFTPSGTAIGNAPIKISDNITKTFPIHTGADGVSIGYNNISSGDNVFHIGADLNSGESNSIYLLGDRFTITSGNSFVDAIFMLGGFNFIDATATTRGLYIIGDSHFFTDYNTYSTLIGESCSYARIDHCSSIGIFNSLTDTTYIYNFGEGNTFNLSNSISNFGINNNIDGCNNIVNVGNGNGISSINNSTIIGFGNINALSDEILIAQNDLGIRIDIEGNVGVGVPYTDSINARNHIKGVDTANSINQRLEPIDGVYEDTTGATIPTTDATVTPLETINIPTDTIIIIESYVTCRKTAGAGVGVIGAGNGYIRTVKAQNIGGVVTIGVVQSSFTSEAITQFNATFAVSGTNVVINVTGAINDNVTWNSITKKYRVS
jgi:hypothetical protein